MLANIRRKAPLVICLVALAALVAFVATTSRGRRLSRIAYHSRFGHFGVTFQNEGRPLTLESDGIKIAAGVYRPSDRESSSGIVLVHGATAAGRKLALYTLLATQLAAYGHVVLAVDLRGLGESEKPVPSGHARSWDVTRDIRRAVDYLQSEPSLNASRISVVGHSMGAAYAIGAAMGDRRITRVVAFEPPRRVRARLLGHDAPNRQDAYRRFLRDRRLDSGVSMETFAEIASSWDLDTYLDYVSGPRHPPILLIDSTLTGPEDRAYLREFHSRMSPPKQHVSIVDVDHYANTLGFGPLIFHDRRALDLLVRAIHDWVTGGE